MSIHPSLKIDVAGTQQRSVQTRLERIKDLMKKGLWKDENRITGLPKTKIVRIKAKKKVKAEGDAAVGSVAAPGAAAPAAGAAKPAAGAAKPAAGAAGKK